MGTRRGACTTGGTAGSIINVIVDNPIETTRVLPNEVLFVVYASQGLTGSSFIFYLIVFCKNTFLNVTIYNDQS